jgi:hypothetical protein
VDGARAGDNSHGAQVDGVLDRGDLWNGGISQCRA